MTNLISEIIDNRYAVTAVLLFVIGFANMLLQPNLIKKVVAFNIMDSATFLMLASWKGAWPQYSPTAERMCPAMSTPYPRDLCSRE